MRTSKMTISIWNFRKFKPKANYQLTKNGHAIPEYAAWYNMIRRCENPKDTAYKDYGGRGISVCERWKENIYNFLDDIGKAITDNVGATHKII